LREPVRVVDTREGFGAPVTSIGLGAGVLQVWVLAGDADAIVSIHPCAGAPDYTRPNLRIESRDVGYARLATAESTCLSSTAAVHVVLDVLGSVSPSPTTDGRQYVPLGTPQPLFEGWTTSNEEVIDVARPAAVAPGDAAVIAVEVLSADEPGFTVTHGCARPRPLAADTSYGRKRVANIAYVGLDAGERICTFVLKPALIRLTLLGTLSSTGSDPARLPPSWRFVPSEMPAPSLHPISPVRVLDTRDGTGRLGTAKLAVDQVIELGFAGLIGPQTSAVSLNVTVTQPDAVGHLTVWPCGGLKPTVSNLNFERGETVPNLVVSGLGPSGTVCISSIAATHVVADLNGSYEADGGLLASPVTPDRILDTRDGTGVQLAGKVGAGEVLELQVGGIGEVPIDAGAATVNVTVTQPEAAGHITAYPCDGDPPTASNLNYVAGQTVPNLVTAKLSKDGRLCLFTLSTTHLVADVAAWYGIDQPAGLISVTPARILDTRDGTGVAEPGKLAAGNFIRLEVAGTGGVPTAATAAVMNITVTQTEGEGFVTVWPCDRSMPTVSNLNYTAGDTRPNLATVKLAADGTVCLYTLATTHLIADVSAYLTAEQVAGQELTLV
jgi:hypothetical protein